MSPTDKPTESPTTSPSRFPSAAPSAIPSASPSRRGRRLQIGDTEAADIFLEADDEEEGDGDGITHDWASIAPEQCPLAFAATDYCLTCSTAGCLGGNLCDVGYEDDACSSCAEGPS